MAKITFFALAGALLLASTPACFTNSGIGYRSTIGVGWSNRAPPRSYQENYGRSPHRGYFWVPGVWVWNGWQYTWQKGYWQAPRSGYRWEPHIWKNDGYNWRLHGGKWRRR